MRSTLFVVRQGEGVPDQPGEKPPGGDGLAALAKEHARLLSRIAMAVVRQPQDAEDVVQETFLQIFRCKRRELIEDERGYLARVAWRLAVRLRKARGREQELPLEIVSRKAGPEQWVMDRQLESWVHQRIDALPEKLRQPLVLAALGELKLVEIAKILRLPEGTVRRRIHDARARLRQELAKKKGTGHERRR